MPMKLRHSSLRAACALISASASASVLASPSASGSLEGDVVRHHLAHQRVERRRAERGQHLALRGLVGPEMPAGEASLSRSLGEAGHTPADFA